MEEFGKQQILKFLSRRNLVNNKILNPDHGGIW